MCPRHRIDGRPRNVRRRRAERGARQSCQGQVARQYFNWAKRDDLMQNTSPLVAARLLVIAWAQSWSRGAVSGSMDLQCRLLPRAS